MMGKKGAGGKLFYQFSLEARVPQDHLLRRVASAVDFSFVRRMTARFYSHTGQPSIDPIVLFKMALIGYLYGITSERRLVQEIALNLAYLWFIGYDLDEPVPNHSVLSKARARFGPTVYLGFFKEIVRQCEQAGLVRGDTLYLDSTLVQANADTDSVGSRALIRQLPDVNAHVERLWQENADARPAQETPTAGSPTAQQLASPAPVAHGSCSPVAQSPEATPTPPTALPPPPAPPPADQTDAVPPTPSLHLAGPGDLPNNVPGLLNEWLVSRVDPEAELIERARVLPGLYYKVHAGVDAGRARIVTTVEVTGGGVADEHLLKRLVLEHQGNLGRHLNEVGADAKYGTVENYRWLEGRGIRAAIPMRENSANRRAVPPDAFVYDPKSDSFVCPQGQRLRRQGVTTQTAAHPLIIYRATPKQCARCPLKAVCCGRAKVRSVSRPDDGGLRDRTAAYLATFQARQRIRRRKAWIETIFGDGKERRGLRRARCRGLDGMRVQAWMTAIAQNVRQLALRKVTRPVTGEGAREKAAPFPLLRLLSSFHLATAITDHKRTLALH